MSAYNETKSQNDVIYSTPQKNVTKVQSKNNVAYPAHPKQDHYATTNSSGVFPSSSRGAISNDLEVQNYYRHVKSSHESTAQNRANSFFDMLQDYQPAVLGVIGTHQRSPGPAEFMQDKDTSNPPNKDSHCNATQQQTDSHSSNAKITRDIKVKHKIHRFLVQPKPKTDDNAAVLGLSVLTKNCSLNEDMAAAKPTPCFPTAKRTVLSPEEIQEHQRQRIFGHYDCQSLVANMNYAKLGKKLPVKPFHSILPELKNSSQDFNYGNELLKSCPHFCNEIGGENDGRFNSKKSNVVDQNGFVSQRQPARRSITPCSVSILESLPNETLWRVGFCPFQNDSCSIEYVDHGAQYFKRFFYTQKHENWFGIDDNFGPMAISIKKEQITETNFVFRVIVRNSELLTLRGLIVEESIMNSRTSGKSVTSKELLEYIAPDIQLGCLRLGLSAPKTEQQLLKLDEQGLQSKYKVGILYCRSGQSSEEDMYNNEHAGPAFTEFLDIIGKRVRLKGFQQYKAGLDNKSDSTGTHSVYAFYKNCEIMFHVCTMLPFTPNNRQQLLRKRHIGNDIVTIVFQEPGALPFDPNSIRSQFQHVFVIVRVINPCSSNTTYRVAITRSKEVPAFGPPLPASALFSRNKLFAEFILAKTINAENASHRSDKFANLAIRTRREYLKDLCLNHSTNTLIDPGNKFSIFANRKKEKTKIQFCTHVAQRGAICWRILLQNHGFDVETECWLGISTETFVIIEEGSRNVVFAVPTRSILGWSTCDNSFRIFYHNGECITFNMFFSTAAGAGAALDEQLQIVERLEAVTLGNGALELNMRRNMMGQLGFHVQPDGIVTQVDANGQAWAAGMRRGYRLVEVCKIVVATLSYAELIDLLKTSAQMNAIVIKSVGDGCPRQGCFNKNCKTNILSQEFLHSLSNKFLLEKDGYRVKNVLRKEIDHQYSGLNFTSSGPYEQRSLPHKSKNSSCYSTPSSCFSSSSLGDEYKKAVQQFNSNTPCSLKNDKWFDAFKEQDQRKLAAYGVTGQADLEHPSMATTASDGTKVQTWLQNGTSNFPQTDIRKLQQRRSPEYEAIAFKNAAFYPSVNYHHDREAQTVSPSHTNKIADSRSGLQSKHSFRELSAFPSTSVIKTAKVGTVINDFSPSPMKAVQQRKTNYPRTKEFRPDLLEVVGQNPNSYTDSLKANSIRMAERDKALSFIAESSKIHEKYPEFEYSSDERIKKHTNLVGSASCSSIRRRQGDGDDQETNGMAIAPPLLPYSKDLDWTTLVDTATKAIILQHRDENSCECPYWFLFKESRISSFGSKFHFYSVKRYDKQKAVADEDDWLKMNGNGRITITTNRFGNLERMFQKD